MASLHTQPKEVHLVVLLTLDRDTYQRLVDYRAEVGAALGEHRDRFDQVASYLLTQVLLDVDPDTAPQGGTGFSRRP